MHNTEPELLPETGSGASAAEIVQEDIQWIAGNPRLSSLVGTQVLVAGSGMLGRYLALTLKHLGCDVTILVRNPESLNDLPGLKLLVCDLEKEEIGPLSGFAYILNCTGPTGRYVDNLLSTIRINTQGLQRLIEAGRGIKGFVSMSSTRVYGEAAARDRHVTEEDLCAGNPLSRGAAYDEAKRLGETLCYAYWLEQGFPVRIARLSNVYGPFQSLDSKLAIPDFLSAALSRSPIRVHSHPENRRNYCYVADAVNGILSLLSSGKDGEAYNIAASESTSVGSIAEYLGSLTGSPVVFPHEKGECRDELISIEKAQAVLGYRPGWGIRDGLLRSYQWHRSREGDD